jgi:hypothetical protein
MRVCEFNELSDGMFEFEICKNAEKGNIELTDTYKMLDRQIKA